MNQKAASTWCEDDEERNQASRKVLAVDYGRHWLWVKDRRLEEPNRRNEDDV